MPCECFMSLIATFKPSGSSDERLAGFGGQCFIYPQPTFAIFKPSGSSDERLAGFDWQKLFHHILSYLNLPVAPMRGWLVSMGNIYTITYVVLFEPSGSSDGRLVGFDGQP